MATHFTYGNTARSSKPLLRLSELGTERESAFTQNVESEEEWFFQRPADMKPPMKLLSVLSPENSSDESLSSSDTDSNNGDSTSLSLSSETLSTPATARTGWKRFLPRAMKSHEAHEASHAEKDTSSFLGSQRTSQGRESSSESNLSSRVTSSESNLQPGAVLPEDLRRRLQQGGKNEHCQYFGCFRTVSTANGASHALRCNHCYFVFCEEVGGVGE